jgi:hypothetical protein
MNDEPITLLAAPPPPPTATRQDKIVNSSNKTSVINGLLRDKRLQDDSPTNKMISAHSIVSNNLDPIESDPLANDHHLDHPDDLLAVESSRSPASLAQFGRSGGTNSSSSSSLVRPLATAPYEAGTKDELARLVAGAGNNSRSLAGADPSADGPSPPAARQPAPERNGVDSRLLNVQTGPTLTPIYLKHPLPAALRPQLIAFPHPASVRLGQNITSDSASSGGPGDERHAGSFALVPSWPNIYITQREHTVMTTTTTTTTTRPPALDPKVPMNYPDWSQIGSGGNANRTGDKSASSGVEYDQQQAAPARRTNLTATSEVEYEHERDRAELADGRPSQARRAGSRQTLLAESWAKLLSQATKNNAMESLMLTNRSIVSLLCDTNNMLVRFKFKRPFYGMVETNLDPFKQCRLFGNGSQYYEMRIDLFECGTRQEMSRLFINNIQIRFQPDSGGSSSSNYPDQQRQQAQEESFLRLETEEEVADEFKTLICSYPPPAPNSHTVTPAAAPKIHILKDSPPIFGPAGTRLPNSNIHQESQQTKQHSYKSQDGVKVGVSRPDEDTSTTTNANNNVGPESINHLSERIIESPNDAPAPAFYFDPILLVAGFLLLLLTIALALISSAYVVRRKQRSAEAAPAVPQTRRQRPSSLSSLSSSSDTSPSDSSMRFYGTGMSPAHQLANQDDHVGLRPVAPPLIGLTKSRTNSSGGGGRQLTSSSSAGQHRSAATKAADGGAPDSRPQQGGEQPGRTTTSPNLLKHKQRQLRKSGRERADSDRKGAGQHQQPAKTPSSSSSPLSTRQPVRNSSASNLVLAPAGDEPNSSDNKTSSPSELSVTTIEIPYVSSRDHRQAADQQQPAQLIRNVSSQTPVKLERNAKSQTVEPEEPPTQIVMEEVKRESSHERIVEKISYEVLEPTGQKTPPTKQKQQQPKEFEPLKRHSPLPFGSFRSKLTSPAEFRRLQNIVRLFDDSQTLPESAGLHKSYRAKISKSIGPSDMRELKRLLNEDETFRSNVVESTDAETFNRKLRNNPRYSTNVRSKAAWDLFEEILLDVNMSRPAALTDDHDEHQPGSPTKTSNRNTSDGRGRNGTPASKNPAKANETPAPVAAPGRPGERDVKIDMSGSEPKPTTTTATTASTTTKTTTTRPVLVTKSTQRDKSSTLVVERARTESKSSREPAVASNRPPEAVKVDRDVRMPAGARPAGDADLPAHQIQVSQTNSTRARCDDNTTINFDTVTNISAPREFSAFTRSSIDLRQVTKFSENDNFPYMDD